MNGLKGKFRNNKGFTLIEMLIVVAIIAILIAIAIPMVNKALERAREATDAANERAALGLAMVEVMTENKLPGTAPTGSGTGASAAYYEVDSNKGNLVGTKPTDTKKFNYGKGTAAGAVDADNAGKGLVIVYTPATSSGGTVTEESFEIKWTT